MIKKLLTVGLLSTTLTGCFYQSVSGKYLQVAVEICGSPSQVHSVDSVWSGDVQVFCREVGGDTWITYDNGEIYITVDHYMKQRYLEENTK